MRFKQMLRGNTIGANGKLTAAWRVIDGFFGAANEGSRWEEYFDYLRGAHGGGLHQCPRAKSVPMPCSRQSTVGGKPLDDLDLIRNFFYSHFNSESDSERRQTVHNGLERIREVFPNLKTKNKAEEYARCRMQCRFGVPGEGQLLPRGAKDSTSRVGDSEMAAAVLAISCLAWPRKSQERRTWCSTIG